MGGIWTEGNSACVFAQNQTQHTLGDIARILKRSVGTTVAAVSSEVSACLVGGA